MKDLLVVFIGFIIIMGIIILNASNNYQNETEQLLNQPTKTLMVISSTNDTTYYYYKFAEKIRNGYSFLIHSDDTTYTVNTINNQLIFLP